jgi:hypothetical protein
MKAETLCACGCGQPTLIAKKTCTARGYRKGEPQRFLPGHNGAKNKFRPAVTPVPTPKKMGRPKKENGDYSQGEAQRFVHFLLCWTFVNPVAAIIKRDPADYREALLNLIQVNQTRHDQAGIWETKAAQAELRALGQ